MDYRDVGHLSDRRLSIGEENAVAIIGMQRAASTRRWVAGEVKQVSVPSVMNAVFDNPKLMAKTIFRSWFRRLGLKIVVRSYNTRNAWIQIPSENSVFDARFLEPEPGTCWEVLVKPDVMAEVRKLITGRKAAPKGPPMPFKKITTPEEATVNNREADLSGRSQTQAASPGYLGPSGPTVNQLKEWQDEVNRIHNEAIDAAERAANPPWLGPSDPATIVENLNELDQILAEDGSQNVDNLIEETEWEPEPPAAPPPVTAVRKVVVPPEVRGWEEDE